MQIGTLLSAIIALVWASVWLYSLHKNKKLLRILGWITAILLLIQGIGALIMGLVAVMLLPIAFAIFIFIVTGWSIILAILWIYGLKKNKKMLRILAWITAILLLLQGIGGLIAGVIA